MRDFFELEPRTDSQGKSVSSGPGLRTSFSPTGRASGRLSREAAEIAIPLGIATLAAMATFSKAPQKVLTTMWISFAIVGTAAVIALSRQEAETIQCSPPS